MQLELNLVTFQLRHSLSPSQLQEADIHEGAFWEEGHGNFIGYCLGPDDGVKTMYATPDKAWEAYERKQALANQLVEVK
jgi:hypothetical protein